MNKMTKIASVLVITLLSGVATAQTCNELLAPATPDKVFEVAQDTVKDLRTGLIWSRCPMGLSGNNCASGSVLTLSHGDIVNQLVALNTDEGLAGKTDWRLPNIKELYSLVEHACSSPSINTTVFPWANTNVLTFWSSTPLGQSTETDPEIANLEQQYFLLDFELGSDLSNRTYFKHSAILVRTEDN